LARFQLDHILSYRLPRLRIKAVNTVPRDMSSAYYEVMRRIDESGQEDRNLALNVLSWVSRAARPLRMTELLDALVVEPPGLGESFYAVLQETHEPSAILECCKGLVIYEESSELVRFAHYTVQEFITTHMQESIPSEIDLAKTCLTYLAFIEFDGPQPCEDDLELKKHAEKFKFSQYAARYWSVHTKGAPEESPEIYALAVQIFDSGFRKDSILNLEHYSRLGSGEEGYYSWSTPCKGQTFFTILAGRGLARLCALHLEKMLTQKQG